MFKFKVCNLGKILMKKGTGTTPVYDINHTVTYNHPYQNQ